MPKTTYWNLPTDKRDAFKQIALEEFAGNDYLNASISRIVARMGIAKGSLYQYFEDKQDLFLFLLEEAQKTMLAGVAQAAQPAAVEGFFNLLRRQMSATVRAALTYPLESQLVQRAYSTPLPFHNEIIEQGRQLREEHLRQMVAGAQEKGEIRREVPVDVAVLMISAVLAEMGPYFVRKWGESAAGAQDPHWFERPEIEQTFEAVIQVLKSGLA